MRKIDVLKSRSCLSWLSPSNGLRPRSCAGRHGSSRNMFYSWRKNYAGMDVPDARRLRQLEDFVSDASKDGWKFRCLTVVGEYSREWLAFHVSRSIPSVDVIVVLERLRPDRSLPSVLVTGNAAEFTSRAFDAWAYARVVKVDYIQPGKPIQNCFRGALQRQPEGRLSQHPLIQLDRTCPDAYQNLAGGLQHRTTPRLTGRSHTNPVRDQRNHQRGSRLRYNQMRGFPRIAGSTLGRRTIRPARCFR